MPELTYQQAFELALQHHRAGRLTDAEALYRQILAVDPQQPESLHYLGLIAHQVGKHDTALELIGRALAVRPDWPEALCDQAEVLRAQQKREAAVACLRRAIELAPEFTLALSNLGNTLTELGQAEEAIGFCRRAVAADPQHAIAWYNLGNALLAARQWDEAVTACRQAIALKPDLAEAYNNLGVVLNHQGQADEAIAAFERSIALRPQVAPVHCNLGNALKDKGQLDEAIAAYQKASSLQPANLEFQSNTLVALHYHPAYDARAIAEELGRWNQQLQSTLPPRSNQQHPNDRAPERRLRIGYVSPDLRDHPVGLFLLPLLQQHDRQQYEIFVYTQVASPDAITAQLRAHTDAWHSTTGLADEQFADLIRRDRIDILVDLAMHTANNRLRVFALKPAPVQVNYLAYVGSSGLTAMDYRLSDPYLDPPGRDESIYCEKTIRLPETYWCFQSAHVDLPPTTREPQPGAIRFGCLNNFCKINPPLIAAWAQILRAVPGSQLTVHALEGDHRQRMLDQFTEQGIAAERITFVGKVPRAEYFQTYQALDISLDTTPYAGGTTTCDSLWMGVPVVTLAGERAVGRGGVSLLQNVGLPELIAPTLDEYVEIAVALANDLPRLRELRSTLRVRMQASPLMNAPRFARNVEAAYREMWRAWCEGSLEFPDSSD